VHLFLGKMFSHTLVIRDDHSLISNGPYRFIRHPMYTAFIIFHVSIFLIIGNWFYGIVWIGGLFFVLALRIRKEEEMLLEVFNEEYESYMQRTGALFFPVFSMLRPGTRNIIFHKDWTFKAVYQEEMVEDNIWILEWLKKYILHYDDFRKKNVEIFVHNKLSQNYLAFLKSYTTITTELFQRDDFEIMPKALLDQYPLIILIQDKAEKESLKLFLQLDKQSEILEHSILEAIGSKNYVHAIKDNYEQSMMEHQQYQMLQFGP
jgi:hypothetical protein